MDKKIFDKIAKVKKQNLGTTLKEEAVLDLIERVTGSKTYRKHFVIKQIAEEKTGMDQYKMYDDNGKVVIEATSGVAAAVAFNTYLKEKCHVFFGPITQDVKGLPKKPPVVGEVIENKSVFLYRYFMNYCTYVYTCIYWKWEQYEKLIDWMLLAGINLVLNQLGHEIVWRDMLMEIGYTAEEANDDICGAGMLPWQIMGNISEFGGDIPAWWYEDQKMLANKMTERLREFGGDVIRPAFYGKVPNNICDKYPDAKIYAQGTWNLAQKGDRPPLIDINDPLYDKMAEIYYRKSKEHFGEIHYYGGDPFHEGGITDGIDIAAYSKTNIETMKKYSDGNVWFYQGWVGNPRQELLEVLKHEEVLIGLLSGDRVVNTAKELFGDYPYMYMQIGNFGGVQRFTGNIPEFLNQPYELLEPGSINDMLVGIGMAMEGIETDEIIYDVLASNTVREKPLKQDDFVERFLKARYGYYNENIKQAYDLVIENIYTLWHGFAYNASKSSSLCTCPNINVRTVGWFESRGGSPYPIEILQQATKLMLKEYDKLKDNECYRFDLMELCRQANADYGWEIIEAMKNAYKGKKRAQFEKEARRFLKLYDLQEAVVRTNEHTLLGAWIQRARDYGRNDTEKRIFEYNVKNMMTLWCGKPGRFRLRDYAFREYDGMLSGYYKRRWMAYFTWLSLHFGRENKGLEPNISFTEQDYVFTLSTENYRTKPSGDLRKACEASIKFWKKY